MYFFHTCLLVFQSTFATLVEIARAGLGFGPPGQFPWSEPGPVIFQALWVMGFSGFLGCLGFSGCYTYWYDIHVKNQVSNMLGCSQFLFKTSHDDSGLLPCSPKFYLTPECFIGPFQHWVFSSPNSVLGSVTSQPMICSCSDPTFYQRWRRYKTLRCNNHKP